MAVLGSPWMLAGAAALTIGWFMWDRHRHVPIDNLDMGLSIGTFLFDIVIVMATNYTRNADRRLLKDIHKKLMGDEHDAE